MVASPEWQVLNEDCLGLLQRLPADCLDSMVTDPPAGIGFMGKEWDSDKGGRVSWIAWLQSIMTEARRVLKPGAHALVWAIPRTSHWTATALEQAGFEIRDVVTHHFGTGFPKSLDVAKQFDDSVEGLIAAHKWEGFGTALKPASEHWILARKPLAGTVAANVQTHGTGALNIDECRIDGRERTDYGLATAERTQGVAYSAPTAPADFDASQGRWPANLILTHSPACAYLRDECAEGCPVRELDGQSGTTKSDTHLRHNTAEGHNSTTSRGQSSSDGIGKGHQDHGGASRFFYVAKPSTAEREEGLAHLPKKRGTEITDRAEGSAGIQNARAGAGRTSQGRANHHPTVKAVTLMSYLVKLITPPGGIVLDPFCGSGGTGIAAVIGGWSFLGIENDPEFTEIARGRIAHWLAKTRPAPQVLPPQAAVIQLATSTDALH